MSKYKNLRNRFSSVFKLARGTRISKTTSLKPAEVAPSGKSLVRITTAEGVIPVSKATLLSHLAAKEKFLYLNEKQHLPSFVLAVDALLYRKSYSEVEKLKELYDVIDPDKEVIRGQPPTGKEILDAEHEMLQKMSGILDHGGFVEVPLNSLFTDRNQHGGICVTTSAAKYETIKVWTRGIYKKKEDRKMLPFYKKAFRYVWQPAARPYTDAVTAVRQKSGKKVWVKHYKLVPKEELLGLLPAGLMKMADYNKWIIKIAALSGASAAGLTYLYQSNYLWAILATSLVAGGWSVTNYSSGRNRFLRRVAAIQYHHCVANNWRAVISANDLIRENKVKDILLAYSFLLGLPSRPENPKVIFSSEKLNYYTQNSLQIAVQDWLNQKFNCTVSYNVEKAVQDLDDLGLLIRKRDGMLSVVSTEEAMGVLPQPPLPWETKPLLNAESVESELVQNKYPLWLQWK